MYSGRKVGYLESEVGGTWTTDEIDRLAASILAKGTLRHSSLVTESNKGSVRNQTDLQT